MDQTLWSRIILVTMGRDNATTLECLSSSDTGKLYITGRDLYL